MNQNLRDSALPPFVAHAALVLAAMATAGSASLGAHPRAPQDPKPATDVDEGGWSEELESGWRYLRQGKREAARMRFEEVLAGVEEDHEDDRPNAKERVRAHLGLARIERELGRYDDAKALVTAGRRVLDHPELDLELARILPRTGDYEGGIETLERASGKLALPSAEALEARVRRAYLLVRVGKREAADPIFEEIENLGKRQKLEDPGSKFWYAKALLGRGGANRLYEASQLLIEVTKKDPLFADAYVARGDLLFRVYREARGRPSGESEYKRVLQNCGEQEAALVALYRSRKENFLLESDKTDSYLRRALAVNPSSVPALTARGASLIDERRFGAARSILQKALTVNPRDVDALAEMSAVCHLLYRQKDEKVFRERVRAVDPSSVECDAVLGKHLVALYRFPDAIPVLNRATTEDPSHVGALLTLGRALLYSGRSEEGARVLDRTKELEKGFVNPWRENQLFLQKRVAETYEKVSIGNFEFKVHPSEKDVLVPYLSREYEAAWRRLGTKYGVIPDCKVQVENFQRFGDFSVRTVGFKGFGALGACFGCLITSVSPAASELRGQFSWKVTAWHEFAHVLHLQLSKARVPRWLTEGGAVFEEIALDPSFDRRMEREVYSALVTDRVIGVDELNKVFGGSQILLGYYQGGLICRHITKEWGFEKVVEIIRAYGEDLTTRQIFKKALGLTPREYDRKFRDYLQEKLGSYAIVPTVDEEALTELLQTVARQPKDVSARLRLAQCFEQRGNLIDCGQQLSALRSIDPDNGDALLLRAKMAARRNDLTSARRLLVEGFDKGGDDFDSRMLYATILEKAGRDDDALQQYAQAIACWPTCSVPGDGSPFVSRARIYRKKGDTEKAVDELSKYASIVGKDYEAQMELAKHWRKQGQVVRELRNLERARDIDPFDRALHERLAEIYSARKNPAEAAFCLGIAIAITPDKDRSRRVAGMPGAPAPKVAPDAADERKAVARLRVLRAEALVEAGDKTAAQDEARRALRDAESLDSGMRERAQKVLDS